MASAKKKSNANGIWTSSGKTNREPRKRFVVCLDNSHYPASLERHKIYLALEDKDAAINGDIRVVDESGEDYLYPADWFLAVELPRKLQVAVAHGT